MASSLNAWPEEDQSCDRAGDPGAQSHAGAKSLRIWLWPNLLSLDAPLVAVVWQILFARCFDIKITPASSIALALAVWLIYVADRVADGLRYRPGQSIETPRHRFYRVNRAWIAPWFALAAAAVGWLSLTSLGSALMLNYVILSVATAGYFGIVHAASEAARRYWPKELAVSILFAAGTCMAAFTALGEHRLHLLAPFLLFAAVIWINTAGIECWEQAPARAARLRMDPKITGFLGFHLIEAALLLAAAAILALLLAGSAFAPQGALYAAIASSAITLAVLDAMCDRLQRDVLRVLADVAMLTPLLFLPLMLR